MSSCNKQGKQKTKNQNNETLLMGNTNIVPHCECSTENADLSSHFQEDISPLRTLAGRRKSSKTWRNLSLDFQKWVPGIRFWSCNWLYMGGPLSLIKTPLTSRGLPTGTGPPVWTLTKALSLLQLLNLYGGSSLHTIHYGSTYCFPCFRPALLHSPGQTVVRREPQPYLLLLQWNQPLIGHTRWVEESLPHIPSPSQSQSGSQFITNNTERHVSRITRGVV